jgi:hypothetical protein
MSYLHRVEGHPNRASAVAFSSPPLGDPIALPSPVGVSAEAGTEPTAPEMARIGRRQVLDRPVKRQVAPEREGGND